MNPAHPEPSPPQIAPRWAWHSQFLEALRDRLLDDGDVQLEAARSPLEPHSMDLADAATDEFDHALALGLLTHDHELLAEVEAALHRIREGSYGICEETGQLIEDDRLRAVPWTRYTRPVEERLEKDGLVPSPHLGSVVSLQGPGSSGIAQVPDPEEELPGPERPQDRREAVLEAIESSAGTAMEEPPPDQP